jgi:hypothetical protein
MNDDHLLDLDRIGKITASIVGAILRLEGCQSRKWAWRVVTGREKRRAPNFDQLRGIQHEDDALAALQLELDDLAMPGRFICHPTIPWLGASPDGFIVDGSCALGAPCEVKCPRVLHSVIPDMYYAQHQVQLECCQAPYGYFGSWTEEGQWIKKVERDPVWWSANYPILETFYNDYIKPDIEPPVSPRRSKNVDGKRVGRQDSVLPEECAGHAGDNVDAPEVAAKRNKRRAIGRANKVVSDNPAGTAGLPHGDERAKGPVASDGSDGKGESAACNVVGIKGYFESRSICEKAK